MGEPYVPQGAHQRFLIDDNVFLDKEFPVTPSTDIYFTETHAGWVVEETVCRPTW